MKVWVTRNKYNTLPERDASVKVWFVEPHKTGEPMGMVDWDHKGRYHNRIASMEPKDFERCFGFLPECGSKVEANLELQL